MTRWLAAIVFCIMMTLVGAGVGLILGFFALGIFSGPKAGIPAAITFGVCTLGGLLFGIFSVIFGSRSQS